MKIFIMFLIFIHLFLKKRTSLYTMKYILVLSKKNDFKIGGVDI